jgi:hypothetical protein
MSTLSLHSTSSYSSSSNLGLQYKAPVLGTANNGLEYVAWRQVMMMYMMKAQLNKRDYSFPITDLQAPTELLEQHEQEQSTYHGNRQPGHAHLLTSVTDNLADTNNYNQLELVTDNLANYKQTFTNRHSFNFNLTM